jgi:ribosome biogenesis GTPase
VRRRRETTHISDQKATASHSGVERPDAGFANRANLSPGTAVSAVRADDDRGRHTTTRRELVALPSGGLLIDSPGIRELQLWAEGADVGAAFDDVTRLAEGCPFTDCSHVHEPRCAVLRALADGRLHQARYDSFLKLRRELAYEEARTDGRAARERKEQERRMHRIYQKQHRKPRKGGGA